MCLCLHNYIVVYSFARLCNFTMHLRHQSSISSLAATAAVTEDTAATITATIIINNPPPSNNNISIIVSLSVLSYYIAIIAQLREKGKLIFIRFQQTLSVSITQYFYYILSYLLHKIFYVIILVTSPYVLLRVIICVVGKGETSKCQ